MNETNPGIEAVGFLIDDRPFCVWEWNLQQRNLEFICSLNPDFFTFLAKTGASSLPSDDKKHSALLLRMAYSHALETFIALVCATLQAPHCIPGWLLKYRQEDLESIARKISSHQLLANKHQLAPVTWEGIASMIFQAAGFPSDEKRKAVVDGFSGLWTRFGSDFLNENVYAEYNNLKHGFRVSVGGFSLAVGEEKEMGVPAPRENMHFLGHSEFGTSYLAPERLKTKNHFRLRSFSRNWVPHNFVDGLVLLGLSVRNLISFLKIVNGCAPDTVPFSWPEDLNAFSQPWSRHTGVTDCNLDCVINPDEIQYFTDDEIRKLYDPPEPSAN